MGQIFSMLSYLAVFRPRNQHILGILIDLGEEGAVSGNPDQEIPMILGYRLAVVSRLFAQPNEVFEIPLDSGSAGNARAFKVAPSSSGTITPSTLLTCPL